MRFEWDVEEAEANLLKHGVSFDEAASVLLDPLAAIFVDQFHSIREVPEIIVGHTGGDQGP